MSGFYAPVVLMMFWPIVVVELGVGDKTLIKKYDLFKVMRAFYFGVPVGSPQM